MTIFCDDGWDILPDCDQDIDKFCEALEGLHPDIKGDIGTSSDNNNHALEHLDLTIYIIDGKISNFPVAEILSPGICVQECGQISRDQIKPKLFSRFISLGKKERIFKILLRQPLQALGGK